MITLTTTGEFIYATGTGITYTVFGGYDENKVLSTGTIGSTPTTIYTANSGTTPNVVIHYILFINNTGATVNLRLYNNRGDMVSPITGIIQLKNNYSVVHEGQTTVIYDDKGVVVIQVPVISGGGSSGPVSFDDLTDKPTTLEGYGITDALSSTDVDTDDVPEGTTNKYYSDTRARHALSGAGTVSYNPDTGVITGGTYPSETDPVWNAQKGSYLTIANANTTYYPLSANPSGYLTSYSETDPTVPSYAKSLTGFSIIQTSTDALYATLSHTHTFASLTSKPTTLSGYGITDAYPNTNPAGYISSYTETDPVWLSDKPNYLTSASAATTYYPVSNPAGYISSYTETDPTVGAHIKAITTTDISHWNAVYANNTGINTGDQTNITGNAGTVTNGVYTTGSYANPAWITSLAYSKLTGTPTTLAGYGITDAYPSSNPNGYTSNTGTVTSVSVVSTNGFAGTVSNSTTTPAITLNTTITGLLKGNGSAISSASAGTDYQAPISLTTTGSSGSATFIGNVLNIPNYAAGSGTTINNYINNMRVDETPDNGSYGLLGGTINSSNTVFTVSNAGYSTGTLQVYLNGQRLVQGASNDWVETNPSTGTFTFNIAPPTGSIVSVSYVASSTSSGTIPHSISTKTANYTITSTDYTILVDASASGITISLPLASSSTGMIFNVKKIDSSGNSVTIDPNGSELIDGVLTKSTTTQWTNMQFQSNGSNWYTL